MLHRTGHTPNVITTYSFAFALLAAAALARGNRATFVGCFVLAYLFDCIDGQFARRYDMASVLGDLYDHTTDVLGYLIFFGIAWARYRDRIGTADLAVFAALVLMMSVHFGCQQRWAAHRAPTAESLDITKPLCRDPAWIIWTRFFSPATMQLAVMVYLVLLMGSSQRKHDVLAH